MKTLLSILTLAALSTGAIAGEACKNAALIKASPAPAVAKMLAKPAVRIAAKKANKTVRLLA